MSLFVILMVFDFLMPFSKMLCGVLMIFEALMFVLRDALKHIDALRRIDVFWRMLCDVLLLMSFDVLMFVRGMSSDILLRRR